MNSETNPVVSSVKMAYSIYSVITRDMCLFVAKDKMKILCICTRYRKGMLSKTENIENIIECDLYVFAVDL